MPEVIVTGGALAQDEIDRYLAHVAAKAGGQKIEKLEILVDGDFVELTWHLAPQPFERIRRITGYLVGSMDRWNNAKTAEEKDRVKHI